MATRIGNQTPTQKYILSYTSCRRREVLDLYSKTGREAQPWQETIVEYTTALNDDGLWAHASFGYAVPRQNGKNEIVAMVEMDRITEGGKVLHTAHRTSTSHTAWMRLCALLDEAGVEYDSIKAKGSENIRLSTGGRIEFRTRSTLGGLGESYDLLVIDEAQEYTDDQATALKYVISASSNPQTIFLGTPPTPYSSGTIFARMRNDALAGNSVDTGWAEWGVEEESDVHDRNLWYQTNPALGIRITERTIRNEIGSDTIDFNIQRLGLWIRYNQKSAISKTEWEALKINRQPTLTGQLFAGIKYGQDGTNVALSIAVKTRGEMIFVEAIDCRSVRQGNGWILDFLACADIREVVIDGQSGQSLLAGQMADRKLLKPVLPTVKEVIRANSAFEQAIFGGHICHKGQPSLVEVVTNCDKRNIGSNGGFGYRSQLEDYDIALMDSVILAHWACGESKPPKRQAISY